MGIRKIRFDPQTLILRVTDAAKTSLAKPSYGAYDGMSPTWEPLLLPFDGTIRFRISFPGLGYHPGKDHTIIDLGPSMSWVIPGDKEYFVSGTLTIPKKDGDHPYLDWSGTLTLPIIKIPTTGKGESDGPNGNHFKKTPDQGGANYTAPNSFGIYLTAGPVDRRNIATERGPYWPEGIANLVNTTNRVGGRMVDQVNTTNRAGGITVNLRDTFLFSGSTANFGTFLGDYSKIRRIEKHWLILHEGVGEAFSPTGGNRRPCDWKLDGVPGWSEDEFPTYALVVHLWTGGKIALNQVIIPKNIEVTKESDTNNVTRPSAAYYQSLYDEWHDMVEGFPESSAPVPYKMTDSMVHIRHGSGQTQLMARWDALCRQIETNKTAMAYFLCEKIVSDGKMDYADAHLLIEVAGIDLLRAGDRRVADQDFGANPAKFSAQFIKDWRAGVYKDPSARIAKILESKPGAGASKSIDPLDLAELRRFGIFGLPELIRQIKQHNSKLAFAAALIITGQREQYSKYLALNDQQYINTAAKLDHLKAAVKQMKSEKGSGEFEIISSLSKALDD